MLANGRYCKGHFVRPADCYLPCSQGALLHLAHRNNGCISTYTSLIYRYIINKDKYPGCSLYYLLASSNRASLPALAPSLFIGCGERPPCSCRSPHRFLALSPVCKIIAPSNFAPLDRPFVSPRTLRRWLLACAVVPLGEAVPSNGYILYLNPLPHPTMLCKYAFGRVPY